MNISEFIVEYLKEQGVTHGYFMIGGALGILADACAVKKFTLYTLHHEQSAAFAAEAQAISTRNLGLAMATSGPGATNLITGIASAYFASAPVLFITGQVNTFESNIDGKRRQVGFQEMDIVGMITGVTKYAVLVSDAKKARYHIEKAIFLAKHGRMGPVLLDLPFDIQKAELGPDSEHFIGSAEHKKLMEKHFDEQQIKKAVDLISKSERPVVLVGHGVRLAGAEKKLMQFLEQSGIPAVTSLLGTDCVPHDYPRFYGFIGTYAQRYSNFALANSDLIIALGSRLDSRQVGVQSSKFAPAARIIHVDIDKNELGASITEALSINCDVGVFLGKILECPVKPKPMEEWIGHLDWLKKTYPRVEQKMRPGEIDPVLLISEASDFAEEGSSVSSDVGSNQMWFAQGWKAKRNQTVLTNGGHGPMGYSLPAAIGASISGNSAPVWMVSGDGGFQINIQELQTVKRHKLPLKMIVLNNGVLGMLTQFQTENFEGRLTGSADGYDTPDFVRVANAYGINARKLDDAGDMRKSLKWLAESLGPALLEVAIPQKYWVYPKAVYSKPVHDMKPFLERSEYCRALKYVEKAEIKE